MRRDFIPEEVLNRIRSVRWFSQPNARSAVAGELFNYYQDVHARVAPIGGRAHDRPDFRVRVEPATEEAEDAIVRAIHGATDTPSEQLASDVCDFIAHESGHLLLFGRAVHEIVPDASGQRYFFALPPGRLLQLGPWIGQLVPRDPIQRQSRRVIWLRRRDLWWITPPPGLGGRALSQLRNDLRRINHIPPHWSIPSPDQPRGEFDFNTWLYKTDVLVGRALRHWGHPIPHPAQRQMTGFLLIREHLRFAITLTRLREHVVSELNRELARGPHPVQVIIDGLPKSSDLESTLGQLDRGELKFADLLPATRW